MKNLKNNLAKQLLSLGATAATGNTASFTLPIADSYKFILDVGAATGTTPTLDVSLQDSPDGGTTWYTFNKFAQVTAAGQRVLIFTPTTAVNQAASETAIQAPGAGAVTPVNGPFITKFVRILYTITGTTPSFASIKVWLVAVDSGQSAW